MPYMQSAQSSSVAQSCLTLCNPWTAACQASLPFTISWSLLKLMSIESVMPSNHLIFYHHLLLLRSIFPSIRVFSNESAFCIRQNDPNSKFSKFSAEFCVLCKDIKSRQLNMTHLLGKFRWFSGKESTFQSCRPKRYGFDPQVGKIPWSRK